MNRDSFADRVFYSSDPGPTLLRTVLTPLAWGYQAISDGFLLTERWGLRKRFRPLNSVGQPVPVIVIGNLSSGGTGKTPMAALVVGLLQAQGKRVVLLSRGHGGSNETGRVPRIVSDGKQVLLTPDEAGDEPVLLANSLPGVPVVVCRDRRKSAQLAVERFAPDVLVLDDGFQHWRLYRDLDIVLLDARKPFDNGFVLPRGKLREPPSHLSRAGIIVLTRADRVSPDVLREQSEKVRNFAPYADIYTAVHAPIGWVGATEEQSRPLDALVGPDSWLALSGIADGAAFLQTVRQQGMTIADNVEFGDHHPYHADDIAALIERIHRQGLAGAVTTEKDMVKVRGLWPEDGPPLFALRIGMRLDDENRFRNHLNTVFTEGRDQTK